VRFVLKLLLHLLLHPLYYLALKHLQVDLEEDSQVVCFQQHHIILFQNQLHLLILHQQQLEYKLDFVLHLLLRLLLM
jgi:hypothetical protein